MRYLTILAVLFSICSADAQVIRAEPFYVFPEDITTSPPADCLLDTYTGAAVAYSLRKLDKDYAGSAIRVRRKSDNTEQNIGFVSDGHLDTASLKTFAGTGATDTAWVVSWYDQSGNLDTASRSVATGQPRILTSGVINRENGRPTMVFDGGDAFQAASATIDAYIIAIVVCKYSGSGNRFFIEHHIQSNTNDGFYFNGDNGNSWWTRRNAGNHGAPGIDNWSGSNQIIANRVYNATDQKYYLNNTEQTNGTIIGSLRSNSAVTTTFNIMARNLTSLNFSGNTQEVIVWNKDSSTDRSGIVTNINNFYQVF